MLAARTVEPTHNSNQSRVRDGLAARFGSRDWHALKTSITASAMTIESVPRQAIAFRIFDSFFRNSNWPNAGATALAASSASASMSLRKPGHPVDSASTRTSPEKSRPTLHFSRRATRLSARRVINRRLITIATPQKLAAASGQGLRVGLIVRNRM